MIHPDCLVFNSSNSRYYLRSIQVPYDESMLLYSPSINNCWIGNIWRYILTMYLTHINCLDLTSLFLTLLMPPASAVLWGRKSQTVNTHHNIFSFFILMFHIFYCHQILSLQVLVKISADSDFSDSALSDSNHTLCDFMNYNLLSQLISNTVPSSFYFALF